MKRTVSIILLGMLLLSFGAAAASESLVIPDGESCALCFTGTVAKKTILYGPWRISARKDCVYGGGARADILQTRSATRIYECCNPDCGYSREEFFGQESHIFCPHTGEYYNITGIQ